MAKTIELFQYVQKIYQIVGICSSSNYHGQHRVSAKATFILGCMILSFNSSFAYFLFEANSVDEYGRSFYMSFTKLEIYLYFVVNLAKVEKILNLIKKLEDFVELSKLNIIISNILEFYLKKCIDASVWFVLWKIGAHNSASTTVYEEISVKIEILSKRMFCGMMSLIVFTMMLPVICLGLVNYYVLDMKDESFELPSPMTYVWNINLIQSYRN